MIIPFTKLEGLGNTFVCVEAKKVGKLNPAKLTKSTCDSNLGVGGEGLMIVDTAKDPIYVSIYNCDGSEAEFSGNGLRQLGLYLKKKIFPRRNNFTIETCVDTYSVKIDSVDDTKAIVSTDMGSPNFSADSVGIISESEIAFDIPFMKYGDKDITLDCVSMGNPHAVVPVTSLDFDWQRMGADLSHHDMFLNGANVNFLKIISKSRFEIKTYERGVGVTSACGSGAAACLAIGVIRHELNQKATAYTDGGKLKLEYDVKQNKIYQTGPASIICSGELVH